MPNFDFVVVSGTTTKGWGDPRLNTRRTAQHLYRHVEPPTAPALAGVVIHCIVDGVEAPLDVDLGGDLFHASRVSWSGSFPFSIAHTSGQTSEITLRFAHNMLGHQELAIRRDNGGAIIIAFDVES